jgi:hypothetical protein
VAGPLSPAGIPSVGDDDRAGHEARCVGGEEQNDGGDLVDFAHARHRRCSPSKYQIAPTDRRRAWLGSSGRRGLLHIPVFDKSNRTDGRFSRADFAFDAEHDRYTCPAGKELVQFWRTYATPRSGVTAEGTRIYRASKLDCDVRKLKAQCCPNALARKIPRDLHEDARDVVRAHAAIRGGLSPAEESRDAVRTSQADSAPQALAPKGSKRSQRRISPYGDRPKPEMTRPFKTNSTLPEMLAA